MAGVMILSPHEHEQPPTMHSLSSLDLKDLKQRLAFLQLEQLPTAVLLKMLQLSGQEKVEISLVRSCLREALLVIVCDVCSDRFLWDRHCQ